MRPFNGVFGELSRPLNLNRARGKPHPRGDRRAGRQPRRWSDQNEIDQGDQGRSDACCDQGVVGADLSSRIERWLAGFPGHSGGLGQAGRGLL